MSTLSSLIPGKPRIFSISNEIINVCVYPPVFDNKHKEEPIKLRIRISHLLAAATRDTVSSTAAVRWLRAPCASRSRVMTGGI